MSSNFIVKWTCWHMKKNYPDKKTMHAINYANHEIANIPNVYDNVKVLSLSEKVSSDEWVMDLDCTFHMTPRLDWFAKFKHINGSKVLMGNDKSCNVIWIDRIKFITH